MAKKTIWSSSISNPFGTGEMKLASTGGAGWAFTADIPGVFGVAHMSITFASGLYQWSMIEPGALGVDSSSGSTDALPRELFRKLPDAAHRAILRHSSAGCAADSDDAPATTSRTQQRHAALQRALAEQRPASVAADSDPVTWFSRRLSLKNELGQLGRFSLGAALLSWLAAVTVLAAVPASVLVTLAVAVVTALAVFVVSMLALKTKFRVVAGNEPEVHAQYATVKAVLASLPDGPIKDRARELESGMWAVLTEAAHRKGFTDSQRAACAAAAVAAEELRTAAAPAGSVRSEAITEQLRESAERAGIIAAALRDPALTLPTDQ